MTDDEFLTKFEQRTLTRGQWTHAAHVRMAWLYLSRVPFPTALQNARSGISKYNRSLGNTTGYLDTVTIVFARLIASQVS